MVKVFMVKYEERVMSVGVGCDIDGWVVVIMVVKVKVKVGCNVVCIDSGGERGIGFGEDKE